jgi:hypothetical protein
VRAAAILVLALASTGCPSLVVRSPKNAPGHVELTPPPHEDGDPTAFVPATDPGERRSMILPGVSWGMGLGRKGQAGELAVQLRFTFGHDHDTSSGRDQFPFEKSGWGGTLGWGIAQFDMDSTTDVPAATGPIYAEVEHHWFIAGVGGGVSVFPDDGEVGPQVSAWLWPYLFRARYLPRTGWEVMGGFQVELPTAWVWSR